MQVAYREFQEQKIFLNLNSPSYESLTPYYFEEEELDNAMVLPKFNPLCFNLTEKVKALSLCSLVGGSDKYKVEDVEDNKYALNNELRCSTIPYFVDIALNQKDALKYWNKYCPLNPFTLEKGEESLMYYGTLMHAIIEENIIKEKENKGYTYFSFKEFIKMQTTDLEGIYYFAGFYIVDNFVLAQSKKAHTDISNIKDRIKELKVEIKELKNQFNKTDKNSEKDDIRVQLSPLENELATLQAQEKSNKTECLLPDSEKWFKSDAIKVNRETDMYLKCKNEINNYLNTEDINIIKEDELGTIIYSYYMYYHKVLMDLIFYSHYTLLATEFTLRKDNYLDTGLNLKGTIDLLLLNKNTGKICIADFKTSLNSKTIEEFYYLSTKNSFKLFQIYLYAELVLINKETVREKNILLEDYSFTEEEIEIMFIPIFITNGFNSKFKTYSQSDKSSIKTGLEYARESVINYKEFIDTFVHFGTVVEESENIIAMKKPQFIIEKSLVSLNKDGNYFECLCLELGVLNLPDFIFILDNGAKVYKYELYIKIAQIMGYFIEVHPRYSNMKPPVISFQDGIYQYSMDSLESEEDLNIIGYLGTVKNKEGNVIAVDYMSLDELRAEANKFNANLTNSEIWLKFSKQMEFKTIIKHLINKTLMLQGDYEIIKRLYSYEKDLYEKVKKI